MYTMFFWMALRFLRENHTQQYDYIIASSSLARVDNLFSQRKATFVA